MKKILLFPVILFFSYSSLGQAKDYIVVFDIQSADTLSRQSVLRQIDIIKAGNPDAKLEVVIYGQALSMVVKDKSAYVDKIQKQLAMKDVTFKVCAITMQRNNVDVSQLIPGVQTVPDGIYEIITKQREGWGYIKVAH